MSKHFVCPAFPDVDVHHIKNAPEDLLTRIWLREVIIMMAGLIGYLAET
jgi:hypothetical protein